MLATHSLFRLLALSLLADCARIAIEDAAIEDSAIEDAAIEDAAIEDAAIEETTHSLPRPWSQHLTQKAKYIQWGWKPDSGSLLHIAFTQQIFNFDFETDYRAEVDPVSEMDDIVSDSLEKHSEKTARSLGFQAEAPVYGAAFRAAIHYSHSSTTSSIVKIFRKDYFAPAGKWAVNMEGFWTAQKYAEHLLPEVRKCVKSDCSMDEIYRLIGPFYVRKLGLGGLLATTVKKVMSGRDTMKKVETDADTSVSHLAYQASVSANNTYEEEGGSSSGKKSTFVKAIGGNSNIAVFHDATWDGKKESWSKSVGKENAKVMKVDLLPFWQVIEKVDKQRGNLFKNHCTEVWEKELEQIKDGQPAAPISVVSDHILKGEMLASGKSLVSQNGQVTLSMGTNGNLVIRHNDKNRWMTKTGFGTHKSAGSDLHFQGDGNLVIRSNQDGKAKWASGTTGRKSNGETLIMANDCNLIMYSDSGQVVWKSDSNCNSVVHR